jgi:hypothetical protein
MSTQSPQILSQPVVQYQFDEVQQASLLLDKENKTWFLFYRTFENSYGVKVASLKEHPVYLPFTSNQ